MDTFTLFTTAFIVGLSGAMMPGPMLTVTISDAVRRGFWAGPLVVAGHAVVEVVLVIALLLGLSKVLQQPGVLGAIGLLGGGMLIWMGWGIASDSLQKRVSFIMAADGVQAAPANQAKHLPLPVAGALTSLSNPYWSLWWATVGLSYVVMAASKGTVGVVAFYAGHILADLTWYSIVSFIIHTGRNVIKNAWYQAALLLCAIFLIFLGCYFMYDGFLKLS